MAIYNPVGGKTYYLSGSISSTATSITLASFLEPVTGTPLTMSNMNTDIAYGTLGPKTTSSEFISFTGVTQNSDGTATLTGVTRGLAKKSPFTTDAAYKLPHSGQSPFILSDAPQVFKEYVSLDNDETIVGKKTFPAGGSTNAPVSGTVYAVPTNDLEYASKKYVDDTAVFGAPLASLTVAGIVEEGTASEINAGTQAGATTAELFVNPKYLKDSEYYTLRPTSGEKDALVGNNTDIAVGTGNKYTTQTGLQKSAETYAASTTGNDTYVVTLSPVPTSLVNGMTIRFKPDTANTGAATLNVNGLGALAIVTGLSTALATGDILANQVCEVVYNSTGTVWQLVNPASVVLTPATSSVVQIPRPLMPYSGVGTRSLGNNVDGYVHMFSLANKITVNKITLNVTAVAVAGTINIGIFSEDGQTRHISVTTGTISGTGLVTTSVSAVVLPAGNYYMLLGSVSTADITVSQWAALSPISALRAVSSEPTLCGGYTVTASTMPSTITLASISSDTDGAFAFRLDN